MNSAKTKSGLNVFDEKRKRDLMKIQEIHLNLIIYFYAD